MGHSEPMMTVRGVLNLMVQDLGLIRFKHFVFAHLAAKCLIFSLNARGSAFRFRV